jgi:cytochrome c oxidase subunit II
MGNNYQSALDSAGPYAGALERLWWFFFITCALVWVATMIAVVIAILRGRRRTEPDLTKEGTARSAIWVAGGMGVTVLVLVSMLVVSVATGREISPFAKEYTHAIKVTGHQWWWQIQYENPRADFIAETANELHLPAGETARITLESADVIHSFWIPNLHGKRDLVPGKKTFLTIRADKPGIYRAQCAEFCGLQHAKMGFVVIVEPKEQFDAWLSQQRLPAPHPKTAEQQRGQQVFLTTTCVLCHAIKGTLAGARTGPDLTHVGSRRTLGAAAIPNTRGNLSGWIADAGSVKPGVLMPPNPLEPDDLHALVVYLESLK